MNYTVTRLKKLKPPIGNEKRAWVKCALCGYVAFYDYLPRSLSAPIFITPCHHDFRNYKDITERHGMTEFWKQYIERQAKCIN